MKLDFPRIVHDVPLSEYTPELKEKIQVWVNPPVKLLTDLADLFKQYRTTNEQGDFDKFLVVLSEILSQGEPETNWTADELKDMIARTADTDPAFWFWMQERILKEIHDYRTQLKKV